MGEHRDDEKELDPLCPIASVSLGAARDFIFRHRDARGKSTQRQIEPVKLELAHGSLLLMNRPTNTFWYHSLPVRKKVLLPRINLTFRRILMDRKRTKWSVVLRCFRNVDKSARLECYCKWMQTSHFDFPPHLDISVYQVRLLRLHASLVIYAAHVSLDCWLSVRLMNFRMNCESFQQWCKTETGFLEVVQVVVLEETNTGLFCFTPSQSLFISFL